MVEKDEEPRECRLTLVAILSLVATQIQAEALRVRRPVMKGARMHIAVAWKVVGVVLDVRGHRRRRCVRTGATCFAPNMKRITGPNVGALPIPTMKSPGTEVSNCGSRTGAPPSRAMLCFRSGPR